MRISASDLRQVAVFEKATDNDLRLLAENAHPRNVEEGGYFFLQGDPATHVHILTLGQAKLLQSNPAGQQVNLRTIYPGSFSARWERSGTRRPTRPARKRSRIARHYVWRRVSSES